MSFTLWFCATLTILGGLLVLVSSNRELVRDNRRLWELHMDWSLFLRAHPDVAEQYASWIVEETCDDCGAVASHYPTCPHALLAGWS